jgi:hypothetical protein
MQQIDEYDTEFYNLPQAEKKVTLSIYRAVKTNFSKSIDESYKKLLETQHKRDIEEIKIQKDREKNKELNRQKDQFKYEKEQILYEKQQDKRNNNKLQQQLQDQQQRNETLANDNLIDKIFNKINEDVITKLSRIEEKQNEKYKPPITPHDIGNDGEQFVIKQLEKFFPNDNITDVSKIPESGDCWLNFANSNITMLIEIKNRKEHRKKEDIEKFQKDIKENAKLGKIQIGIFVNLQPVNFANIGGSKCFHYNHINQIPCVWLSDIKKNPNNLQCHIQFLHAQYIQGFHSTPKQSIKDNDDIIYKIAQNNKDSIEQDKNNIEIIKKQQKIAENKINELAQSIKNKQDLQQQIFNTFPKIKTTITSKTKQPTNLEKKQIQQLYTQDWSINQQKGYPHPTKKEFIQTHNISIRTFRKHFHDIEELRSYCKPNMQNTTTTTTTTTTK